MAGIVPGLMMGLALVVTWLMVVRKDNVQPLPRVSGAERLRATGRALWALGMPVIILGGIKAGVVTPTEAAVVAAAYALFVGMVIYRELTPKELPRVILQAAKTTSVIMFLVCAALVSAWLITAANIPAEITGLIEPLIDRPTLLMFVIMILVLIVGTALDLTPTILILTPVLMPIIKQAGIDPVYFGVLFIMNNCIGLLTPPVGVVLNVVSGVGRVPWARLRLESGRSCSPKRSYFCSWSCFQTWLSYRLAGCTEAGWSLLFPTSMGGYHAKPATCHNCHRLHPVCFRAGLRRVYRA